MTAPDPTAGERVCDCGHNYGCAFGSGGSMRSAPASPPAVAASTGTSEDVEALRAWVRRVLTDPAFRVGPDVRREELVDVIANRLAAREAAARAEERERVAQAIEAHADRHAPAHTRRTFVAAARIAREGR